MLPSFKPPPVLRTALVALLLATHAWLALSATIELGVTGDETVHLTGGYSYWRLNDYRLHPENGNLPQRWAALPLLLSKPHFEPMDWEDDWRTANVWMAGQHFFFQSGNSTDYLLLCSRTTMVWWSIATGLLVFFWSRSLWGETAAIFSLALYTFSPTTLAHGPLVTSDMCAAFWLLASTWAWWRLMTQITPARLIISLVASGLAFVSKFSGLLLVPLMIAMMACRLVLTQPLLLKWRSIDRARCITTTGKKAGLLCTISLAHLSVTVAVVWLFFGFRYTAFNPASYSTGEFFSSFDAMMRPAGVPRWVLLHAREYRLLPEGFLQGLAYVLYGARQRAAFAAGEYGVAGWWWFFPFAFLVKSSLAELLACACLSGLAAMHWLRSSRDAIVSGLSKCIPILCLGLIYGGTSLLSHLNIGQRHILPLYPAIFILAGAIARPQTRATGAMLAAALVGSGCMEALDVHPDYLAFFNRAVGGPRAGWRMLGDSSVDWGQDLPRLQKWLERHQRPNESVYLSYFGADDPYYRGIRAIELSPYYSFGRQVRWAPLRGGLYCIGVSMLQDASSPFSGSWSPQREALYQRLRSKILPELAAGARSPIIRTEEKDDLELWALDRARFARLTSYLRARSPDAAVGNVIFIYRLTDDEIQSAVNGTLAELAGAIAGAIRTPRAR